MGAAEGRTRIAVYDDAYAFGGHELMLGRLLRGLARAGDAEVLALFSHENRRHVEDQGLDALGSALRIEYLPFANPRRLGNLAALLSPRRILRVLRRLRAFRPDAVLVAQGGIDTSLIGVLASRLGGYRTLSYIPNLNGYCRTHPSRKNRIRDRLNQPFHRLPHEFVVIREGHRKELRDLGFRGPVRVVPNAVEFDRLARLPKGEARAALGLEPDGRLLGLVGRIDLVNKGHGLAVEAMAAHPEAFRDASLLVVGEGPDEEQLRNLAQARGLADRVRILGFRKDLSPVYSALDALLIPSRSEGVPLVMLEALHYDLPVLASAVDGMLEYLPPAWLFPPGDARVLAQRVAETRAGTPPAGWSRADTLARFEPARFHAGFREALGLERDPAVKA